MARKIMVDFGTATGAPTFRTPHMPAGDYPATISKVEELDAKDGEPMLLYSIKVGGGVYPYYCKLVPNQLWKLRELLEAAGIKVPARAAQLDPAKPVGRKVTATMADDEYKGRMRSAVAAILPPKQSVAAADDEDDFDDFDDEPEEKQAKQKAKAKSGKKAKKKSADDEDDFDELD